MVASPAGRGWPKPAGPFAPSEVQAKVIDEAEKVEDEE